MLVIILVIVLVIIFQYYRDKVQMEYLDFSHSTPSGEDLYVFRFSRTAAAEFCQRHEAR